MLTTEIWGFAYPQVGDPTFSIVSIEYSAGAPYLFGPVITERNHEKSALGFHLLQVKQVKSEKFA